MSLVSWKQGRQRSFEFPSPTLRDPQGAVPPSLFPWQGWSLCCHTGHLAEACQCCRGVSLAFLTEKETEAQMNADSLGLRQVWGASRVRTPASSAAHCPRDTQVGDWSRSWQRLCLQRLVASSPICLLGSGPLSRAGPRPESTAAHVHCLLSRMKELTKLSWPSWPMGDFS